MTKPDKLLWCPFCTEPDFDKIGLKWHLMNGHCTEFNNTIDALTSLKRNKHSETQLEHNMRMRKEVDDIAANPKPPVFPTNL